MIGQQLSIVLAEPSDLIQTLISVEAELFVQFVQLLRLLTEHELECLHFIFEKLVRSADQLL